jgi:hypothetical protein
VDVSLITSLRPPPAEDVPGTGGDEPRKKRPRLSRTLTVLAAVIVFVALVVPDNLSRPRAGVFLPGAFLRIPLEGIIGFALLILLPTKARRVVALLLGAGLGVLMLVKMIDMGFRAVLARRFDPVLDGPLFGNGFDYLNETYGKVAAIAILVAAIVLVLAMIAVVALSVLRLAGIAARFRKPAIGAAGALLAAWVVFALVGTSLYPLSPVASTGAAGLIKAEAVQIPKSLNDKDLFTAESRKDAFRDVPATQRLAGLRGKDIVINVVESYGRSALTDPAMSKIIEPALTAGAAQLTAAGFSARSGWLTSSTYGGGSWLAHASFQSGLWINNQGRYRQLTAGNRLTLTSAFHQAGWHTVAVEPGNHRAWPEAKFYGYDEVYDSRNLGYQGPQFGWSSMPDQYTLASFQKNVYGKPHAPLMSEITLTSSHSPWTVIPNMVDWNQVGNGSIFDPMAKQVQDRNSLWQRSSEVRTQYAKSISYTMNTVTSWAATYGDDNLVMIFFGDHQPVSTVSGVGADHDIPITIVAKDKTVLDRIASWDWADGIQPAPNTPVWKMDQFRDKFFTAFGTSTDLGASH